MKYILGFLFVGSAYAAMDIPQIQVQGNCEMKVIPDRGSITFTAENQAKDQKVAVEKTTEQITKLREAIKGLKLENLELKSSYYSVFPVREWEKEKMVEKGYRASLSLEIITSNIEKLGEAMMKASSTGITNVGQLRTFLSLEKSQKEYLKCLDVASEDAKQKAKQLGDKLGFKVGKVISLIESPNIQTPQPYPMPERAMMKTMDAAAPVQIDPGTQQYSTNIQVTFSIQ